MNHITQEQAIELARDSELDWHAGYLLDDERDNRYHALCNAAIEWYIAQQAASVDATFKKWNAEKAKPIYYMRDNHTFKKLSDDVPTALVEIEEQLNAGYTSGMLCSKRDGFENIHSDHKERMKFLKACKERLEAQQAVVAGTSMEDMRRAGYQAAKEPVAYFDFQEHGFYWAPNVKVGDVPVSIKVAPMPLSDAWIRERTKQPWIFETVKQWVREIEQAHGIKEPKV